MMQLVAFLLAVVYGEYLIASILALDYLWNKYL